MSSNNIQLEYEKLKQFVDATIDEAIKNLTDKPVVIWFSPEKFATIPEFISFLKKAQIEQGIKADFVKVIRELKSCKSLTKINPILYTLNCPSDVSYIYYFNYVGLIQIFDQSFIEYGIEFTNSILRQAIVFYLKTKYSDSEEVVNIAKDVILHLYKFVGLHITKSEQEAREVLNILSKYNIRAIPFYLSSKYNYIYVLPDIILNPFMGESGQLFNVEAVVSDKIFVRAIDDNEFTEIIRQDLDAIHDLISDNVLNKIRKIYNEVLNDA